MATLSNEQIREILKGYPTRQCDHFEALVFTGNRPHPYTCVMCGFETDSVPSDQHAYSTANDF
jgi:hypothetical protein